MFRHTQLTKLKQPGGPCIATDYEHTLAYHGFSQDMKLEFPNTGKVMKITANDVFADDPNALRILYHLCTNGGDKIFRDYIKDWLRKPEQQEAMLKNIKIAYNIKYLKDDFVWLNYLEDEHQALLIILVRPDFFSIWDAMNFKSDKPWDHD